MRVGTRTATGTDTRTDKDHPHACGDKMRSKPRFAVYLGSSPCVWGQALIVIVPCERDRIIPMRVGTS